MKVLIICIVVFIFNLPTAMMGQAQDIKILNFNDLE